MFHMYDKKMYKCDVTCSLRTPPPVTNCHTFSDPLPLERDILYVWPQTQEKSVTYFRQEQCLHSKSAAKTLAKQSPN